MSAVLALALLGALSGLGAFVCIEAARGVTLLPRRSPMRLADRGLLRLALALGAALVVWLGSGWPVAALFAAALGAWLPSAVRASGRVAAEIAKVEAIATWTEQLRDTLAAANGLESAIVATSRLAPRPIRAEVERLGARVEYERTTDALRRFADEVANPVCDFVVAALTVAAEKEARDLASLLGSLASTAHDEARMRNRVWVGRARTRTSVRVIAAVVPMMVVAVMMLDRHYFDPYNSSAGQVALLVVGLVFVGSLAAMERLGRIELPARFVGRAQEVGR